MITVAVWTNRHSIDSSEFGSIKRIIRLMLSTLLLAAATWPKGVFHMLYDPIVYVMLVGWVRKG